MTKQNEAAFKVNNAVTELNTAIAEAQAEGLKVELKTTPFSRVGCEDVDMVSISMRGKGQ